MKISTKYNKLKEIRIYLVLFSKEIIYLHLYCHNHHRKFTTIIKAILYFTVQTNFIYTHTLYKTSKTVVYLSILILDPILAKPEVTIAAGTVSDLWSLFCVGGLPSNVADLCTEFLNSIGSSVGGGLLYEIGGGRSGCEGISSIGWSRAPRGSFSVTNVRGDVLKYKYKQSRRSATLY